MRVALFGGSFDPPHRGHVALARAAADSFALDLVLFAPAGRQPLKKALTGASYPQRLAMVSLACAEDSRFAPSELDAPHPDGLPNYTVDTLVRLQQLFPDAQRFNLAGADSFVTLGRWREPLRMLGLAEWIVVSRPGFPLVEPEGMLLNEQQRSRIHLLDSVHEDVAATGLRERLHLGDVCTDLLPARVSAYIEQQGLYRSSSGPAVHPSATIDLRSPMPSKETYPLLLAAAAACEDKKAEDIRILALDPTESGLTDYFLICNGTNDRQNVAITDEIEIRLKRDFGTYPTSVEGRRQGEWILMDYVDFIVHVFSPEKRAFYGLERLRKSATTISVAELNTELKSLIASTRTRTTKQPAVKKSDIKTTSEKMPLEKTAKGLVGSGKRSKAKAKEE